MTQSDTWVLNKWQGRCQVLYKNGKKLKEMVALFCETVNGIRPLIDPPTFIGSKNYPNPFIMGLIKRRHANRTSYEARIVWKLALS